MQIARSGPTICMMRAARANRPVRFRMSHQRTMPAGGPIATKSVGTFQKIDSGQRPRDQIASAKISAARTPIAV